MSNCDEQNGQSDGQMKDLKRLLMDIKGSDLPLEFKRRMHALCAKFLGGVWRNITVDQMHLNKVTGGMSNMLFQCRLPDNLVDKRTQGEPDKTLVRVYFNPEIETHVVAESVIFTLLSERHLGPRLYGIFNGGRLEEYISSRPLDTCELWKPELSVRIAARLAGIHQLEVPIEKDAEHVCAAMEKWRRSLKEHRPTFSFDVKLPNSETFSLTDASILEEIRLIKRCTSLSNSPVNFCHNDLQEGNILLPKASTGNIHLPNEDPVVGGDAPPSAGKLVIIDFEYASYNHRAFDFANHFCEWTFDYSNAEAPGFFYKGDKFPTVEQQSRFFTAYLAAFGVKDASKVEQMMVETSAFVAVSHFFWTVWALLQAELSPIGFGYTDYAETRLRLYHEWKPKMMEMLKRENNNQ